MSDLSQQVESGIMAGMSESPEIVVDQNTFESEADALRGESKSLLADLSSEVLDDELAAVLPDFDADDLSDLEVVGAIEDAIDNRETDQKSEELSETSGMMFERLVNLKSEDLPLKESLAAFRSEFKGQIDEETDAVLAQFEALFSPELIPDPEERKAVETLFFSQGVSEFTPAVFSCFLDTIYEQPDETISAETKERIRERFQPPVQRIETAGELKREAFRKNENGEFEYDSPENALQMENGMSAYAQPDGQMAISFASAERGEPKWTFVQSHRNWLDEQAGKRLNYMILHRKIFEHCDGLTGLFGGRHIDEDWPTEERDEAVEDSSRFIRCFVGSAMEPHQMLQVEHMRMLIPSLKALVNPRNLSPSENLNDLRDLGVLNGTEFNWSRLKTVGSILRENHFFSAQALKDPTLPHQLLVAELQRRDQSTHAAKRRPTGLTSATGQSGGR